MANEKRARSNLGGGLVEDNPLTSGATLITSTGLNSLPVIDTTNHLAITVDPDGYAGAPEIVYVTAHTSAATTATILRGQEGTSTRQHAVDTPWVHSVTTKDFDGATGGSGLIGQTSYNPGSVVTNNAVSTSYADADATNLVVAFTAPPSGKVLVSINGNTSVVWNNTLGWGLRESTTDLINGEVFYQGAAGTLNLVIARRYLITGLVAGSAHSYKWAHARTFGSGGCGTAYGGTAGPALMEVWAVNC